MTDSTSNSMMPPQEGGVSPTSPMEEVLVCPITLQLPIDPVTAQDGFVYERTAIEKHFEGKIGTQVQSPMTGVAIGTSLLPAPQYKNTIEALIKKGFIAGDAANKWETQTKEKQEMKELLKKAKSGDVKAMESVGTKYWNGDNGFPCDCELAFYWYDKARVAGSLDGLGTVGYMMALGLGTDKNEILGVIHLTASAAKGNDWAAWKLGSFFAGGKHGVPFNIREARFWLQASLGEDCRYKNMSAESRVEAQQLLDKVNAFLPNDEPES